MALIAGSILDTFRIVQSKAALGEVRRQLVGLACVPNMVLRILCYWGCCCFFGGGGGEVKLNKLKHDICMPVVAPSVTTISLAFGFSTRRSSANILGTVS